MKKLIYLSLPITVMLLIGCQREQSPDMARIAALQQEILRKQDLLLQIHLDLDAASSEISDAEISAMEGNCSGAGYHASEAYRKLEKADEAILDLGRDLQAMFNLDSEKANL